MLYSGNDLKNVEKKLKDYVLGALMVEFIAGDVWIFRFYPKSQSQCIYIVFHSMDSPSLVGIEESLRSTRSDLFSGPDADQVTRGALAASLLRREVIDISLDEGANFTLIFENSSPVIIKTDTKIVDWQWYVGERMIDPYIGDFRFACFWQGEVDVK